MDFMVTIRKNIIINAPTLPVWGVVGEPSQWGKLNPNIANYSYSPSANGGYNGEWVYALGKLKLHSKVRTNIYEPGRRLVVETCGQMKSKWTWWLESDGDWTHLALTVEYNAKWSGIGVALQKVCIEHVHSETLDTYLGNIKRTVENSNQ